MHVYSVHQSIQVYYDSKFLASLIQWYICFLPGWSGAEIKYSVEVVQPKLHLNQFKLDQQIRQQKLIAYSSNMYTVLTGLLSRHLNFEPSLFFSLYNRLLLYILSLAQILPEWILPAQLFMMGRQPKSVNLFPAIHTKIQRMT